MSASRPWYLGDLLIFLLELGLGSPFHFLYQLAFRGDGAGLAVGELALSALEKEIQEDEPSRPSAMTAMRFTSTGKRIPFFAARTANTSGLTRMRFCVATVSMSRRISF